MKGMVIIDSNHFGKSMELVECIKEKVIELVESLSYAEMGEKAYDRYEDREKMEKFYGDYYGEKGGSSRSMGIRRMPRGRFDY